MFDTENCGNPNCEACNPRTARRAGRDEGASLGDILAEAIEKRQREIGERMRRILNGENFSVPSAAAEGIPSLGDILRDAMDALSRRDDGDINNRNMFTFFDESGSMSPDLRGDLFADFGGLERDRMREADLRRRQEQLAETARQRKASATVDDNLKRATRRVQQARKALQGANPMLKSAARADLMRLGGLINELIDDTYL